jgi:hypothetical protein
VFPFPISFLGFLVIGRRRKGFGYSIFGYRSLFGLFIFKMSPS